MTNKYNLLDLGWNECFEKGIEQYGDSYSIGRVAVEYRSLYKVYTEDGEIFASVSGKMINSATGRDDYPAVGDWVILDKNSNQNDRTIIRGILERKSKFSRKVAGNSFDEQIIAANIDIAFICMSLNNNFNLRRLERYITMAWDSGARPVVLLTKADLCKDVDEKLDQTSGILFGIDVHCISCVSKSGISEVENYLEKGITVAFIGSSGVGKSTIINELLGESRQITQEVSNIGEKGRHTTTNRELVILPEGGVVIDTPGMRELHILDVSDSIDTAFKDIEGLSLKCKFSDCTHSSEPNCAVKEAISNGTLSKKRYESYVKLKKEAEYTERKLNRKAEIQYKKLAKKFTKSLR
ncbi:ribosome small subunit-dependent GTPase A [Proteiniborus sp.]|uniref:ribosome small subunit-dependent GTPase A n=1 Tax=Proteiniborus sp. TaxID=2079015 RepID=UPI00331F2362